MAEKKSVFKKVFSKPNQSCCNVEIEEDKSAESKNCSDASTEDTTKQQKKA